MNRNEKPLTLDELRDMDGKPLFGVSLITGKPGEWFICRIVNMSKTWFVACAGASQGFGDKDTYGETWVAYAAEPPRINREAWQPCEYCGDYESLPEHIVNGKVIGKVFDACICEDQNGYHIELPHDPDIGIQYCPVCGRPLTDSAWKQLEERLVQK